jgi:predicted ATPase
MRIDRLKIRGFKNLDDVVIDFDQNSLETVLIGQNGSGKSNVIEALATIFRDLDYPRRDSDFDYHIAYDCKDHRIEIDQGYSKPGDTLVTIDGAGSTLGKLRGDNGAYLPNHVFGYYSGRSERLERIFDQPQKRYYETAIKPGAEETVDPRQSELRRLFYVRERYGALALLTYFAFGDGGTRSFLHKHLGVRGFNSALLVLRQPEWGKKQPTGALREQSDPRFWYARGLVRKLLDGLWQHSLAPFKHDETINDDYRRSGYKEQQMYLFIKDEDSLLSLATPFKNEQSFFSYLETLDLSDLIRDIRIWVDRQGAEGEIPFHEVSDGEKQLLSVLGMMRFAAHDHSLFLLDEPDTHLNPAWKWNYLFLVREVAGRNPNCHVIMASHDPLTIAGLEKTQVQILYRDGENGPVRATQPNVDPKGLGVAGVLRQVFGMPTTLDPETQALIDDRNMLLQEREKGVNITDALHKINAKLDSLGLAYQSRDPDYDSYLRALHDVRSERQQIYTPKQIEEQDNFIRAIIKRLQ